VGVYVVVNDQYASTIEHTNNTPSTTRVISLVYTEPRVTQGMR
jgi:hypothetical protein